jgi:hypothetical protein
VTHPHRNRSYVLCIGRWGRVYAGQIKNDFALRERLRNIMKPTECDLFLWFQDHTFWAELASCKIFITELEVEIRKGHNRVFVLSKSTSLFSAYFILDIQGLQSDWPLLPLDLTVANSAPGHYSRYWACSPCAAHHKLLLVKLWFFGAINLLISWTLSIKHSARRTRLLKLHHYLRQWSVFIWRNSQRIYSTLISAYMHCILWDPRTSYF